MTQVVRSEDLISWLNQQAQQRVLVAPVNVAGLVLFKPVTRAEEIVLHFNNTVLSPKEWFFPASGVLFTVGRKDGHLELRPNLAAEEGIIFGLRPCDARGIAILDKPFLNPPADTFYQQRRARATLVGLACRQACPECFCTSMGTAPDDTANLDALLTEVEEGYIVQAITEKGEAVLKGIPLQNSAVTPPPAPSPTPVPAEGVVETMRRVFEAPYWSRLADRCIHCNLCAYVCPVCYCFDIRDYTNRDNIERIRSWESCQSPGFTRIAGGYDPRAAKGARLRQRFYHKLLYMPEQFGVIGCTGCGRCVRSCPVNIDIREVISDVQKIGAKDVR
jgi:ferredoxin